MIEQWLPSGFGLSSRKIVVFGAPVGNDPLKKKSADWTNNRNQNPSNNDIRNTNPGLAESSSTRMGKMFNGFFQSDFVCPEGQ